MTAHPRHIRSTWQMPLSMTGLRVVTENLCIWEKIVHYKVVLPQGKKGTYTCILHIHLCAEYRCTHLCVFSVCTYVYRYMITCAYKDVYLLSMYIFRPLNLCISIFRFNHSQEKISWKKITIAMNIETCFLVFTNNRGPAPPEHLPHLNSYSKWEASWKQGCPTSYPIWHPRAALSSTKLTLSLRSEFTKK